MAERRAYFVSDAEGRTEVRAELKKNCPPNTRTTTIRPLSAAEKAAEAVEAEQKKEQDAFIALMSDHGNAD